MTIRLLLGLLVAVPLPTARAGEAPGRKRALPDVLVVADAAVKDDSLRPTPGKPIHYVMIGGVEQDIGETVTDVRRPNAEAVRREMVKALAGQGFMEAREGGAKPQLAILFSWGTAHYFGNEGMPAAGDPKDKEKIRQLLGLDKAERRLYSQYYADQMNEAFGDDRVYVVVAALDLGAAARKERRLLWRTRMSLDWRDDSPETLGVLLKSAAPFFGREVERGEFIDDDKRRKAEVNIGELRVVPDSESKPPAPNGK